MEQNINLTLPFDTSDKKFKNYGATYTQVHYDQYSCSKDLNLFEEVIDLMMIQNFLPELIASRIRSMDSLDEKRISILAFLDSDSEKGLCSEKTELYREIKLLINGDRVSKMKHLEKVIYQLREYVKVGEVEKKKFGEVMTDINLVKKIVEKIPKAAFSNPNIKFLDPANGTGVFPLIIIYKLMKGLVDIIPNEEDRYKHILLNQIYVSEIQPKNMFLYMCLLDPYSDSDIKLNIYCGNSLEKGFDKHMKEVWCVDKFDYIIGNPPFNQMIDLKFIQKFYKMCEVLVFVHPSTWLIDEKGKQKAFIKTKELVENDLESIELFNGNKIFGIVLAVPCCITYINKKKNKVGIRCLDRINKVDVIYDDINHINKYSNLDIYTSLRKKIIDKTENNLQYIVKNDKGSNFYVNISQITGNVFTNSDDKMVKDDFYTLVGKGIKPSDKPRKQREKTQVSFIDEESAYNFINYLKTNFVRFCLSILKNNKNVYCGEMSLIPWLDFTKEWSDDKLYSEFNITSDEIRFIEKHIPKFY